MSCVLRIRDVYPGSRIRTVSIPDPGARIRIKEFKYFNPNPDPDADFHPGSRIPDPGVKKAPDPGSQIPDPNPQHWLCVWSNKDYEYMFCMKGLGVWSTKRLCVVK
jgi:hypothetical protein